MQFQLIGWGPDLDPSTPGILVDTYNVVPQEDGYVPAAPMSVVYGAGYYTRAMAVANINGQLQTHFVNVDPADVGATAAAVQLVNLNGISYFFDGSVPGATLADNFTLRPFDGRMLFNRRTEKIRHTDGNSTAVLITASPTCEFFETTKDFVVAFRADNGAGITPDWWCCAIGDYADWTPSVSNQCVYGTFYGKEGQLTAAGRYGEALLAFTDTQTYVGRYVGAPDVWQWERFSGDIGCVGPEAQCQTPYGAVFVGRNDIYIFDGANIGSLNTDPVRKTIFSAVSRKLLKHAQVFYERKRDLLWFAAPSTSQTTYQWRDYCTAYHFKTKRWGRFVLVDKLSAFSQIPAYDWGISTATPISEPSYDDLLVAHGLTDGVGGAAVFSYSNTGQQGGASGYVETGYLGDQAVKTMIRSVRPRFTNNDNNNGTLTLETRLQGLSGGATATQTAVLDADFKYPLRQTGRWHSFKHVLTGSDVVNGYEVDLVPMGTR